MISSVLFVRLALFEDCCFEIPLLDHHSRNVQKNDESHESPGSPRHRKVSARWVPDEACRPLIDEAPVFYPTEEEFQDTLGYIASIRSSAEAYVGSDFTLEEFQRFSEEFKAAYFEVKENTQDKRWLPSVDDIEGEYWRIIEQPTDEVEVYYGADLETGTLGSGFPKESSLLTDSKTDQYMTSGWNLNNLPRLAGSVLSFEECNISGHVDHHLYSLNYLHWGDPKVWYGVPGSHASALENAMRKHLPDLFEEQPDLLNELVTQLSPSVVKSEVNVAPIDWLRHGQSAIELYSAQHHKTSISHDKLLLAAAGRAVQALWDITVLKKENSENLRWKSVCGKMGFFQAIKTRVYLEEKRIECLPEVMRFQKMQKDFDLDTERECFSCFYDLHLFAACCDCSSDKFACLKHANLICRCDPENRLVLLRYTIDELNTLVKALEESMDAVEAWVFKDRDRPLDSKNVGDCILDAHKKLFGFDLFPSTVQLNTSLKSEHMEQPINEFPKVDSYSERRTSFCIEPINFGSVVFGKPWFNKDAIYPQGYKSRVKFFNICNPLIRSSYTSEIVDGGLLGPLFKVSLEEHPQESFVHVSAEECWELVLQRLNQEITRQKCLGKQGLPPVQPSSSINGLEMFGLLSPSIVQAIEALDPYHKCTEYWENKLLKKKSSSSSGDTFVAAAEKNSSETKYDEGEIADSFGTDLAVQETDNLLVGRGNSLSDDEIQSVFRRLLSKANSEEMEIMHRILCKGPTSPFWRAAVEMLTEEIRKRQK
ncbi:UNVERIFIED_CONTAM: Lysine-specific demethylase [Sesamum angustifolium]|uniref:Lysine-specific demethylase n=1 Tax=Sesamum angustifolium TaxID=2727405 RepID=A0AAW2PD84_9LAMI